MSLVWLESTNGYPFCIDEEDLPLVSKYKWVVACQGRNKELKYVQDTTTNRIRLHRLLLNAPDEMFVDHIDGNGLNNTRSNIRLATPAENARNKKKQANTTSKYKGVHLGPKGWKAHINAGGKPKGLGRYHTEVEAAIVYDEAATKAFGEFAKLNFPDGPPQCELKGRIPIAGRPKGAKNKKPFSKELCEAIRERVTRQHAERGLMMDIKHIRKRELRRLEKAA